MEHRNDAFSLKHELDSFRNIWKDGYFEGDPLDPMGSSNYGVFGYQSNLYATYLHCIRPYIHSDTNALEIGPGRGAWTKTMLQAKELWCLDALSAEHNGFWQYVGKQAHIKYIQVTDFSCDMLPNDHFDYLFSFGCFPHMSFTALSEYMLNLYPKLR